jgi:hypothetical protein
MTRRDSSSLLVAPAWHCKTPRCSHPNLREYYVVLGQCVLWTSWPFPPEAPEASSGSHNRPHPPPRGHSRWCCPPAEKNLAHCRSGFYADPVVKRAVLETPSWPVACVVVYLECQWPEKRNNEHRAKSLQLIL